MYRSLPRIFALSAFFLLSISSGPVLAAENGSITGIILIDGKPAPGFLVKLTQDVPLRADPRRKAPAGNPPAGGVKTVVQTTTDPQGRFTFRDVAPGDYRLEGGNRTTGWLYINVTVESGKQTDVGEQRLVKLN